LSDQRGRLDVANDDRVNLAAQALAEIVERSDLPVPNFSAAVSSPELHAHRSELRMLAKIRTRSKRPEYNSRA
jgi:hypothetical protein